jgi:hypothetical protein
MSEESTSELMYVGSLFTSTFLYIALARAYFYSEGLKSFLGSLVIGETFFAITIIIWTRVLKRYFFYWKEEPPQT